MFTNEFCSSSFSLPRNKNSIFSSSCCQNLFCLLFLDRFMVAWSERFQKMFMCALCMQPFTRNELPEMRAWEFCLCPFVRSLIMKFFWKPEFLLSSKFEWIMPLDESTTMAFPLSLNDFEPLGGRSCCGMWIAWRDQVFFSFKRKLNIWNCHLLFSWEFYPIPHATLNILFFVGE